MLANAPLGWRVSLVDTPGFGEDNPTAMQVADRALKSSSAHLYVVNKETLKDSVDAKFYREFEEKDQGKYTRTFCTRDYCLFTSHPEFLCVYYTI